MNAQSLERQTMRLVSLRLLPFLFVLYIFNFLDRTNISVAALQMNQELGLSAMAFGFAVGIFHLGYAPFELPSNLILARVGARRWLARIMISWGVLACATAWVHTPAQFYLVRFLLGVAEAGFFPGVIYYLSQWFPASYRARAIARFGIAIPLSQAIGGPLGGALLGLSGVGHLSGWQWLFLVEGLPSVLLGVVVLGYLTERPEQARWLSDAQRNWLRARLDSERTQANAAPPHRPLLALRNPVLWVLVVPYLAYFTISVSYIAWAPLLVRAAIGTSDAVTGLVTGAIAASAALAFVAAGALSDRREERAGYSAFGLAVASVGCFGAALVPDSALRVAALVLIPIGCGIFMPTFWCLPTKRFTGPAAAAAIALLNSIGSLGGLFGPGFIGLSTRAAGDDAGAFMALAGLGILGSSVCLILRRRADFRRPVPIAGVTLAVEHAH